MVGTSLSTYPKIGPLKVLQLRTPTPQTEHKFEASFNASLDEYRKLLHEVAAGALRLPNDNLDTGALEQPGKYRLNDETHANLLDMLAKHEFQDVSPELRADLLDFFAHPNLPHATKRKPKAWAKVQRQLMQLRTTPSL